MVTEALERARKAAEAAGKTASTGGLSLGSLPAPDALGPIGAYLAGDDFGWCNGRVLFAGGSEVAFIDEPRLIEAVRTGDTVSLARVLDAVAPRALAPAEAAQGTTGGGNPRFGAVFDEPAPESVPAAAVRSCAVVSDRPALASGLTAALESRSVTCHAVDAVRGFDEAAKQLEAIAEQNGPLEAVVVATSDGARQGAGEGWERVLASHRGIVEQIHADAAWARATADQSAEKDRPMRLVVLTDGSTPGGRSRAQAFAQLSRAAGGSTKGRVTAFAVSLEGREEQVAAPASELVSHLLADPDGAGLAGAELVVDADWLGLRSHPRPTGSVVYGGPAIPAWLDRTLRDIAGSRS